MIEMWSITWLKSAAPSFLPSCYCISVKLKARQRAVLRQQLISPPVCSVISHWSLKATQAQLIRLVKIAQSGTPTITANKAEETPNIALNILPALVILCPWIITCSKSCPYHTPASVRCQTPGFNVAWNINFQCITCCALRHVKHLHSQPGFGMNIPAAVYTGYVEISGWISMDMSVITKKLRLALCSGRSWSRGVQSLKPFTRFYFLLWLL